MMVDMNTRKVPTNTELLACFNAFDRAIETIVEWHKPDYNICGNDVEDFRDNIHSLIRNCGSPDEYFGAIGHGAFKECYEGLGNWIIKFVSCFNSTGAEKQLLDAARDAHLDWLFLNTIFIDLPVSLKSVYLEDAQEHECELDEDRECHGDCGTCEWYNPDESTTHILESVQLQPQGFASCTISYHQFDYNENHYNRNPVRYIGGSVVPYKIMDDLGINDQDWVQALINCYGDENFHRFCRFVEKFELSDLHAGNTGYITTSLGDMPILLDWMSRWSD